MSQTGAALHCGKVLQYSIKLQAASTPCIVKGVFNMCSAYGASCVNACHMLHQFDSTKKPTVSEEAPSSSERQTVFIKRGHMDAYPHTALAAVAGTPKDLGHRP